MAAFPTSPANGDTHTIGTNTWTYSSSAKQWIITTSNVPSVSLTTLTDVNPAGATTDSFIKYNGTNWVVGSPALSNLTDVNPAGAATDNFLTYNGTNWVVDNPAATGGSAFSRAFAAATTAGTVSSGGGGIITYQQTFTTSGTFTAPYDGTYRISLIGGGGTGWVSNTGGSLGVGAGGGGGACVVTKTLSAGDTFTYTLGAQITNSGRDRAGSAGNASTATISGTTLTAGGGGGGNHSTGSGGAGGTATGGDINYPGAVGGYGNPSSSGGYNGIHNYSTNTTQVHYPSTTYADGAFSYSGTGFSYQSYGSGGVGHTNGTSTGRGGALHVECYI